jgi:hypothetical protein
MIRKIIEKGLIRLQERNISHLSSCTVAKVKGITSVSIHRGGQKVGLVLLQRKKLE